MDKRILNEVTEYFVKWKNYDETTWEPLDPGLVKQAMAAE